jgi:hypothetical protein
VPSRFSAPSNGVWVSERVGLLWRGRTVSDAFAEFIGFCLEKEPNRRPASRELLK